MNDDDKYRARFRRKIKADSRYMKSLEVMGLTLDDAVEIELWLRLCGDEPDIEYPMVVPKHQ